MSDVQQSPLETFRQEADLLLSDMETTLLDLEERPQESELVHRLFRSVHTIKGSGSMFGFPAIAELAHHVENLLDRVRNDELPVNNGLIDLVLASRDQIKSMLESAEPDRPSDPDSQAIMAAIQSLLPSETDIPPSPAPETESPPATKTDPPTAPGEYRIRFCPAPELFRTGSHPRLLIQELEELGDCQPRAITEAIPLLETLNPELCHIAWDIRLKTRYGKGAIEDVFIFVSQDSDIQIETLRPPEPTGQPTVEAAEPLLVSPAPLQSPAPSPAPEPAEDEATAEEPSVSASVEQARHREAGESIRVGSDKIDGLINLVGELVITQARLSQIRSQLETVEDAPPENPQAYLESLAGEISQPVETLEQLTADLRDCALEMRMIPIGTIFGKFRRLVRDLSNTLEKEAVLSPHGGETELDKTVIERLNDPLIHLIRNSMDHGIARPDRREQAGKPRHGTIRLSAAHRGPNVVITVEDDGEGMDPRAIGGKAVQKGLLDEAEKLSPAELLSLIFLPGFSTAPAITNVSGRGVGLDVVKREIESLGGTVAVQSEKGRYTRFKLALPLTLAIIDGLMVRIDKTLFVLPLSQVEHCAEIDPELIRRGARWNLMLMRGELLPYIRLREFFHMEGQSPAQEHMAVVQAEDFRLGLVVDDILGNVQTVIKPLNRHFRQVRGFSGATITGDGTVALILDIPELIRFAREEGRRER